jgi:hypothetical protein
LGFRKGSIGNLTGVIDKIQALHRTLIVEDKANLRQEQDFFQTAGAETTINQSKTAKAKTVSLIRT